MTDVLAWRYRAVMLAYPRSYRARRGDELLDTLLEFAAPDQRWPTLREVASILVEGVRERIGAARRRPSRMVWIQGLQIMVVLLLAGAAAPVLTDVARQQLSAGAGLALILLALATTGAVLRGRWVAALPLTGAWLAAQVYLFTVSWQVFPISWYLLAAVLALAVLAGRHRSERPVRSAWWLLAVPAATALLTGLELPTRPANQLIVVALLAVAGLAGTLLDPRAPIVAAGLLVAETLRTLVELPTPGDTTSTGVIVLLPTENIQATMTWTAPHTSTGVVFFVTPTWWALALGLGTALLFLASHLGVRRRSRI